MFWWYTARKFPNCFILMLFPQLNGYWYQYQWVEKIPFDILMTPWHQYKTVYTLSRNKLHHRGGGVQNSFLSIFGNQTDNSDNCSLISMTSGTKGYQLLCRELKDETPIKQLQHGGWLWGNLWGRGLNRYWWWFPAMLQEAREILICGITELSAKEDADEHPTTKFFKF